MIKYSQLATLLDMLINCAAINTKTTTNTHSKAVINICS